MCDEMQNDSQMVEEKETYKLYNYMEKHHSLLIASISAVVAVASLVTSVLIFVYQCIVLQSWKVSMELVGEVKGGKLFYIAILGALYYFCVPIYQMCIQKIIQRYYLYFPLAKVQKRISKKLYCLNKRREKEWKEALKELKKSINGTKRLAIKKVLGVTLGASILLAFSMFLFQISLGNVKGTTLFFVGSVLFIVLLGASFFLIKRTIDRSKIKEFEERTRNILNSNDAVDLMKEIMDYQKDLSSVKATKRTIKEYFCDRSIGTFVELMIETFVCLCVFFVLSGTMTAKTQNTFWIYEDKIGKNYVVIYQNEEKAIMKEAEIRDNSILINLDRQMIKTLEENQFKYMKFEHVERVEEKY